MKNGLNKFIKGIFAIFTIKVFVFSLIFIVQACENNINEPENIAKENFLSALRESLDKINNIPVKKIDFSNVQARDLTDGTLVIDENVTKLCLDFPIDNTGNSGVKVSDVIALDLDIIRDNDGNVDNNGNYCYEIDENEAVQILNPAVQEAKNYLYTHSFSDDDINEILKGQEDSYLVPLVILMIENETSGSYASLQQNNIINSILGVQTIHAQNWGKIGACVKQAFGLDDISEFKNWKKMGKKAQNKLLGKVAGKLAARYASAWVGVALIVGQFALCMR